MTLSKHRGVVYCRRFISRCWLSISRLRLSPINDWKTLTQPLGNYRSLSPITVVFSRIPMERYNIYLTVILLGWGFQVKGHR